MGKNKNAKVEAVKEATPATPAPAATKEATPWTLKEAVKTMQAGQEGVSPEGRKFKVVAHKEYTYKNGEGKDVTVAAHNEGVWLKANGKVDATPPSAASDKTKEVGG